MIRNRRRRRFKVPQPIIDAEAAQLEIARTGNKQLITSRIYNATKTVGGKKRYLIRDKLRKMYHDKCAYCETKEHKPEIEHYRPKKSVADDSSHQGYYWLCYAWTNLIPACHYCNTEGAKVDKFPIRGTRARLPDFLPSGNLDSDASDPGNSPLADELPFLFHPEYDEPESSFSFTNKGEISGIDAEGRGAETIRICKLNRDNLLYHRQKIVDDIKGRIKDAFTQHFELGTAPANLFFQLKQVLKYLKGKGDKKEPFSLMARYSFEHFESMLVPLLPTPVQQNFAIVAYREFLQG